MRIIGIDPGYAILGYGIVEKKGNSYKPIEYGSILTPAEMPMADRLKHLYAELTAIIEEFKPVEASVEELFFNKNTKTALLVGQARGVVLLACANKNLDIHEYTPLQIKLGVVGYGRAEKKQVQMMMKTILNLKEVPKPDDTADALAAAICHGNQRAHRILCREQLGGE